MIKISDKFSEVTVFFPKTYTKYSESYKLVLESETNQKYIFDNLIDVSEYSNYYCFSLILGDVADGEYKYTIEGKLNDCGLILVGKTADEKITYKSENRIIQYE